ncbi:transposable element Tcb2 transposase [Trichonephila clavipes]|nr:transposable element Tcb2 transposase [Trichonephila clavipes]
MDTLNEIKIKQEENLDSDEEKLQQPITIIKNDIRFEDLQTFFQKYNLEIPIQTFIRNFESTCDSFNIPEKQKILFIIKLVDGAVKTYIQSQSIPKSFYELKNNLIREFGTQVNPAEIHLQLSKTEKTSKETHIEYFYRVKEIASRINMEEEAEKYYIIRGLKENRAIEIQLQSCSNIEELKEKMKLLDIQEKSKSSKNEVIYPKYPRTRIPYHTNQFAHIQQYGGWNWRNDQSQHPDTITNTRYKVYSPQFPSPYHHPSFSLQRPTLYPRNQRFPQRPTVFATQCSNFLPRQRTQNNNTVFQPHQTRELMIIQGRINFKQVDVLLDTGSRERERVNIIPKNIISQIKGYHNVEYIKTKIATINGEIEDLNRFLETGSAGRRPGQGRSRATTPNKDRYLLLTARRHRNMNAILLQQHLRSATGTMVSTQTVRNRLHGVGLYARRPMVCVRLTSRHCRDRRQRIFIWRDRGSRNNPAFVHESVRFGGGGVLVYGGISIDGRTDLYIIRDRALTARRYRDEILRPIIVPYTSAIGDDFILMDDNCRPHRANLVEDFLFEEGIVRME